MQTIQDFGGHTFSQLLLLCAVCRRGRCRLVCVVPHMTIERAEVHTYQCTNCSSERELTLPLGSRL